MAESPTVYYEKIVFDLSADSLGPNRATLLFSRTPIIDQENYKAVLYIHGYNDYYFQDHVCQRFLEKGFDFYALDLRKCGRSIISPEEQKYRHYCRDLNEYDQEINLSIDVMIENSDGKRRKLFLFGHSTGGLIVTLYRHSGARRDEISGLILNSPYLSPVDTSWSEMLMLSILTSFDTSVEIPDHWYGRSIHRSGRGEWDFDITKKPIDKFRVHGGFHSAVQRAQNSLKRAEIKIQCPVIVLCSSRSMRAGRDWRDEYDEVDLVLNVTTMKQIAKLISVNLTLLELPGAKHDVFLSNETVREKAFEGLFRWFENLNDSEKN